MMSGTWSLSDLHFRYVPTVTFTEGIQLPE
jgi:hypothetical protein